MNFNLNPPMGAHKKKFIVGRGQGSGLGKTSGRGSNGQNSRSGGGVRLGFEGGQLPLYRRLPRRGFSNSLFKENFSVINLKDLEERFDDNSIVEKESLKEKGLIRRKGSVKLLGEGLLSKKLVVKLEKASKSAINAINKAGGSFEAIIGS